jgi:AcrR family transcriptional regulator
MPNEKYHHGDLKNALITAGIEILAEDGESGLSLRKVAGRAGVSHSAPYAHFADKQALIAAISTEGYRLLYEKLQAVCRAYSGDPLRQLVEAAWAYTRFALDDPAHFKITFSGILEKEKDYPEFVEMSKRSFSVVEEIVRECQNAGLLESGPTDAVAVSVWSMVHGFVLLLLENQISHNVTDRMTIRGLLVFAINRLTTNRIPDSWTADPDPVG